MGYSMFITDLGFYRLKIFILQVLLSLYGVTGILFQLIKFQCLVLKQITCAALSFSLSCKDAGASTGFR